MREPKRWLANVKELFRLAAETVGPSLGRETSLVGVTPELLFRMEMLVNAALALLAEDETHHYISDERIGRLRAEAHWASEELARHTAREIKEEAKNG